ncbi:MAG: hypothetical protein JWO58_1989, partial [Chitinophagaceae bacterium]|nr:hypothetical protein [Chitinophagaceae bacterium]
MTGLSRTVTFSVTFHLKNNNYILLLLCLLSIKNTFAQNPADLCSSAVTLTPTLTLSTASYTLPGTYVYDGLSASCMTGTNEDDGWYQFTAQTSHYTFELTGDYTHTVGIYSGACGTLTEVACGNAAAGSKTSVVFTTVPGNVYYLQVQRNSGTGGQDMNGTFALYYSAAPGGVANALKAWYKADGNLVKSGSTVTRWNTEYGNANFTNVFNAPQYSSNTANFNPAVVFGGNDYINNSSVVGSDLLSTSDNTVFIVSKLTAGTSGVLLKWEEAFPNDRFGFEGAPYPVATEMRMDHPTTSNQKLGGVIGDWNICTGATNATTDSLYQNGLVVATNSGGTNSIGLTGTLTVGGDNFSGYHSNSSISEIIFFGTTLPAFEQQKVQSYLAVKYGITLGTNANPLDYYSSNGTMTWEQNSSSQNDIAGIARDDNAGLSQLKSKSANTDDIVTMALVDGGGSFATPNAFSADNSSMLWGNDNGTQPPTVVNGGLVESTVECPSSILRRLSRQWLIYETGTVGNVALTMDLTSIPVSATTFYDMRLLIDLDGDGDFTTGTVKRITPSSYSAGIVTFNSVDFIHGQVFTLATLTPSPGGVSTGLEIWLKASSLTSTTTNLAQLDNWYNAGSSNFDFNRISGSSAGWPRFRSNSINFNPSIQFGTSGAMISLDDPTNMRPTINNSTSMVVFKTTQSAGTSNFWASPNFITTETYYTGRDYGFGLTGGKLGLKIENGEPWDVNSTTSVNDNIPHVAMAMRSRGATVTTPSTVMMQFDGKTDVTATSAGDSYPLDASDATGTSYKGTGIGGTSISGTDVYTGVQYTGLMPEAIVFNNALSAVNLNK